jgi:choice-of-anchor B domain-containing protein
VQQNRVRHALRVMIAAVAVMTLQAWTPEVVPAQIADNVTLLAQVNEDASYNDIWGYTAPGGAEYAILGTYSGTAFYNVTDPSNPVRVGFIDGPDSIWRDMKTFGDHCYMVTEEPNPISQRGLQIVSLADPENPTLVNNVYADFNSAHNLFIDTATGRAYVVGHDGFGGGMLVYDLNADPVNPTLLGSWNVSYIHDVYVKNGLAYAALIYEGRAAVLDVNDPANITEISSWTYPGASTHNTWTSADQTVLVTSDETSGGHLNFWDITSLGNPTFLDDYQTGSSSSAHNAMIRGGYCYVSYYTEGLRILSLADPANVEEVGYYDTYAGGGLYEGAWGVYPFAAQEGIVYVSDITNGLFILEFDAVLGAVTGTVRDAATTDPIEGATVTIVEAGTTRETGPDGTFAANLAPGDYTLEIEAFGYAPEERFVTITASQTEEIDIAMNALPAGSLAGTVTSSGDVAIEGAMVTLDATPLATTSGPDGSYGFPSVPAGSYTARAERFRYGPATAAIDVVASQPLEQDFTLPDAFYWTEMESDPSWTVGGDASTGQWVRVDPIGTGGGTVQPEDDHTPDPGVQCWVTGQGTVGGAIGDADVDGGATTLTTSAFDLGGLEQPMIEYQRWYSNDAGANPGEDAWVVEMSPDGGANWYSVELTQTSAASWTRVVVDVRSIIPAPTPLAAVQLRFTASDYFGGSIVEAAIDDFQIVDAASSQVGIQDARPTASRVLALHGNAPNPFNPQTTIRFDLRQAGDVRLRIFDATGRLVRTLVDRNLETGAHATVWDGRTGDGAAAASGVYFYRLEAGGETRSRRMVLAK